MSNKVDYLKLYRKKLRQKDYHLYDNFPLSVEDYNFAKTLEDNFEIVRQIVAENAKDYFGFDIRSCFGLRRSFKVEDIKDEVPKVFATQEIPLPFSDTFREHLLNGEKYLVKTCEFQSIKNKSGRPIQVFTMYFVTKVKYKGEYSYVLLKVDVTRLVQKNAFNAPDSGSSVNITAKLGRNGDIDLNLGRFDYKPLGAHQNFFDENGKVLPPDFRVWKKYLINQTHFHFNSERSQALRPRALNSADVVVIQTNKTFMQFAQDELSKRNFYLTSANFSAKTKLSDAFEEGHKNRVRLSEESLWGGN